MRAHGKGALSSLCGIVLLVILIAPGCDSGRSPRQAVSGGGAAWGQQPSAEQLAAQERERREAEERAQQAQRQRAFDAAFAAYKAGNYPAAYAGFSALAQEGVPGALSNLGVMVQQGHGTAADPYRAYGLFAQAAQSGFAHGAMNAGFMQVTGDGTEADPEAGAARIRSAMASPELRDEIRSRTAQLCADARAEAQRIPTIFDLFKKHMPGKATLCAFDTLTAETQEKNKFANCVRAACQLEVTLGEADSCQALFVEGRQNEQRRALLQRIEVALGCSA